MKALYARISTDDKNQTIETQTHLLTGKYPDALFLFTDEGVRGKSHPTERKGWSDLVASIETCSITEVHVVSISRISRDLMHTFEVFKAMAERGVLLVSESEGTFDLSNPEDEFRLTLLAGLNKRETAVMGKRIKWGMERAKANGVTLGRKTDGDRRLAQKLLSEDCPVAQVISQSGLSRATVYRMKSEKSEGVG